MEHNEFAVRKYARVNRQARKVITDKDVELEYIAKAVNGDTVARDILLNAQLLSLYSLALKRNFSAYRGEATEMVDVVAANFDEILSKFDPSCGVRLFTFLVNWARSYMGTELMGDRAGIRVPANIFKSGKANEVASCISGHTELGNDEEEDGSFTIFDTIADPQANVFDDVISSERRSMVKRYMTELDDEEKLVIGKLFFDENTIVSVAKNLHISKEKVCGIRDRAIKKMAERAEMELGNTWQERIDL